MTGQAKFVEGGVAANNECIFRIFAEDAPRPEVSKYFLGLIDQLRSSDVRSQLIAEIQLCAAIGLQPDYGIAVRNARAHGMTRDEVWDAVDTLCDAVGHAIEVYRNTWVMLEIVDAFRS